jgi:flavin-dependent dehydrogenase
MSHSCESVAVIGAGPSGCAAAWAAANAGIAVVVYERAQRFRDKACGDMFLPAAVDTLHRMGLDAECLRDAGGQNFHAIDVLGTAGRLWLMRYTEAPLWVIPRSTVDQAMRDCLPSAVQLEYGTRVASIVYDGACWRIGANRHSAVILACGAASALATQWNIDGHPGRAAAISAYTEENGLLNPMFKFCARDVVGYRWAFPIDRVGRVNVGVFSLARVGGAVLKQLGSTLGPDGSSLDWRGGVGTLWSGRGERWHHMRGLLACGDAAGLIDPVTGEGLSAALSSGEAAGTSAAQFALNGNHTSLEHYSSWINLRFTRTYARSPVRAALTQLSGAP